MEEIFEKINALSHKYRDYTAENLSKLIKIKSTSGFEKHVQLELKRQMDEAGFDVVTLVNDLSGTRYSSDSKTMGIIAKKR